VRLFLALLRGKRLKGCMATSVSLESGQGKRKLLDRVREAIRFKHYSLRTEQAYVDWIKRFILFHGKRHPESMGAEEVRTFLTDLAVNQNVAASTQNQAFSALLFLYRDVLKQDLPWIDNIERAKRPAKVPVVLTPEEARAIISKITRDLSINGTTSLWLWPSRHGVCALACKGHRFRISSDHSARCEGWARSNHNVAC
jgi:integrase